MTDAAVDVAALDLLVVTADLFYRNHSLYRNSGRHLLAIITRIDLGIAYLQAHRMLRIVVVKGCTYIITREPEFHFLAGIIGHYGIDDGIVATNGAARIFDGKTWNRSIFGRWLLVIRQDCTGNLSQLLRPFLGTCLLNTQEGNTA